ncbi:MAG: hypothetical protein LC118_20940 [Dehalococcoidia bacterium]|nr:hypothetical protein [Dehalococcoidia bacterium]
MNALALLLLAAVPGAPCSMDEPKADAALQFIQSAKRVRSWCDTCPSIQKPVRLRVASAGKQPWGKLWQLTLGGKVLDPTSTWLSLADGSERRLSSLIACTEEWSRETRGAPPKQLCGEGSPVIERLVDGRVIPVPAAFEYEEHQYYGDSDGYAWKTRDRRNWLHVIRDPNFPGPGPDACGQTRWCFSRSVRNPGDDVEIIYEVTVSNELREICAATAEKLLAALAGPLPPEC